MEEDRYRYQVGRQEWGRRGSPVMIDFQWRSELSLPDLDAVPEIGARVGIDLYASDPGDPDDREWMRALVWPENLDEAQLLDTAMQVLATDPPRRLTGDAQRCMELVVSDLPSGMPVVVFHAATRAHVPRSDRPAFDAAIERIGETRDLFHLSLEGSAEERFQQYRDHFYFSLKLPDRAVCPLARTLRSLSNMVSGSSHWTRCPDARVPGHRSVWRRESLRRRVAARPD